MTSLLAITQVREKVNYLGCDQKTLFRDYTFPCSLKCELPAAASGCVGLHLWRSESLKREMVCSYSGTIVPSADYCLI